MQSLNDKKLDDVVVSGSELVEHKIIYDNKGKLVPLFDGKYDLRDHDVMDIIDIIQIGIRNDSHRGLDTVVLLPVGWVLISTEDYNKRIEPSWWVGTMYEKPILIVKITVIFVVILTIPYVALTFMENMPDEWRIVAKDKQSSSGG